MIPAADSLITFTVASLLLGLAPGPDNLFVLTQSALHGCKAGIFITLGLATGLVVHTGAVALGVAVIFQTSPAVFNSLKITGGIYLAYLAWQAFHTGSNDFGGTSPLLSAARLYRRGIIMNTTNPKVALFFLAFLPQFTTQQNGFLVWQVILLGVVFILTTLVVFVAIAILAGNLGTWLKRSPKAQLYLNRMAGTVLLGLALKLVSTGNDGF